MVTNAVAVSRLKNYFQQKLYESPLSPFYNPEYSQYDEKDNTFELEARVITKYMLSEDNAVSSLKDAIELLEEETSIRSIFIEITSDELWEDLNTGALEILENIKKEFDDSEYDGIPILETRRDFYSFGDFLEFKRNERSLTVTAAAGALNVSRRYYSDVEKGARLPFDKKNLIMLAEVFNFNEFEKEKMFDLAAKERDETPLDIASYLVSHEYMYEFIRRIKNADINKRRLFSFLKRVEKKKLNKNRLKTVL